MALARAIAPPARVPASSRPAAAPPSTEPAAITADALAERLFGTAKQVPAPQEPTAAAAPGSAPAPAPAPAWPTQSPPTVMRASGPAPPPRPAQRLSSAPRTVTRAPISDSGPGGGASGGGSDGDGDYHELLGRLRAEQEQLGQLIPHPF
jgi:hypothetical protein